MYGHGICWSQLTKGDPNYTLVQVSVNDLNMIFAFSPIAAMLLGVTDIDVPWSTLILSGFIMLCYLDRRNMYQKYTERKEILG
ncbi:MAG: hypothetical protein CM1200mP3_14230 [Chloroflexota bacterium]|nr:MAG: hypothetical protein CM1200mP3_14230 [Chloroflexota bacterium]